MGLAQPWAVAGHILTLPVAALLILTTLRAHSLFKTTEMRRVCRLALAGVVAFLLHDSSCLLGALLGAKGRAFLGLLTRGTGFLTLALMGATILAFYKFFAKPCLREKIANPFRIGEGPSAHEGEGGGAPSWRRGRPRSGSLC